MAAPWDDGLESPLLASGFTSRVDRPLDETLVRGTRPPALRPVPHALPRISPSALKPASLTPPTAGPRRRSRDPKLRLGIPVRPFRSEVPAGGLGSLRRLLGRRRVAPRRFAARRGRQRLFARETRLPPSPVAGAAGRAVADSGPALPVRAPAVLARGAALRQPRDRRRDRGQRVARAFRRCGVRRRRRRQRRAGLLERVFIFLRAEPRGAALALHAVRQNFKTRGWFFRREQSREPEQSPDVRLRRHRVGLIVGLPQRRRVLRARRRHRRVSPLPKRKTRRRGVRRDAAGGARRQALRRVDGGERDRQPGCARARQRGGARGHRQRADRESLRQREVRGPKVRPRADKVVQTQHRASVRHGRVLRAGVLVLLAASRARRVAGVRVRARAERLYARREAGRRHAVPKPTPRVRREPAGRGDVDVQVLGRGVRRVCAHRPLAARARLRGRRDRRLFRDGAAERRALQLPDAAGAAGAPRPDPEGERGLGDGYRRRERLGEEHGVSPFAARVRARAGRGDAGRRGRLYAQRAVAALGDRDRRPGTRAVRGDRARQHHVLAARARSRPRRGARRGTGGESGGDETRRRTTRDFVLLAPSRESAARGRIVSRRRVLRRRGGGPLRERRVVRRRRSRGVLGNAFGPAGGGPPGRGRRASTRVRLSPRETAGRRSDARGVRGERARVHQRDASRIPHRGWRRRRAAEWRAKAARRHRARGVTKPCGTAPR